MSILETQRKVQRMLESLEADFHPRVRLTFVARHLDDPGATVIVTSDDERLVADALLSDGLSNATPEEEA